MLCKTPKWKQRFNLIFMVGIWVEDRVKESCGNERKEGCGWIVELNKCLKFGLG